MSSRVMLNAAAGYAASIVSTAAPSDPYYDNVSLLLNGDVEVDSNFANVSLLLDGNTLTDKSNNKATVTANGNVAVTSVNKKFGTGSYYFDGNGDYLSIPASTNFSFGTGDVTIEAWIWWGSATYIETGRLICGNNGAGSTDQFGIFEGYGMSCFGISNNVAANYPPVQQWVHVACSKQGSTVRLFINGVMTASGTQTAAVGNSTYPMLIGTRANDTQWNHWWNGYIDDFRITKGVARYTSAFTPPVKALPTHEILDSSVYRLPVTAVGNARIDTATKKYGTGAMYFDGTGDYLTLPSSTTLDFGTGNFTIEFWINVTALDSQYPMILSCTTPNNYLGLSKVSASTYKLASNFISSSAYRESTAVMNTGTWYYIAVVRSGTTLSFYINNTLDGSVTESGSLGGTTVVSVGYSQNYPNSYYLNGYIDDLRITKGIARTITQPSASLPTVPPTISADPWWSNVSLLLDGNTTDDYDPYRQNVVLRLTGDDFIDWSNQHNAITNNSVTLSTATKRFNNSSYYFSGSGQYLTMPANSWNFGSDNFTIEAWVKFQSISTSANHIIGAHNSGSDCSWVLYIASNGMGISWNISSDYKATCTFTSGIWYHIALVRSGTTITFYQDGNSVGTSTLSGAIASDTRVISIGGDYNGDAAMLNGYLADLRITKGIARTITVPTAALPSYKIQDRTQNNLTLTPYGNVQLSTDVMKNGTGSMYFDGTGDYLKTSASSNLCFGTGDFTIELWYYPLAKTSTVPQILNNSTGWGANAIALCDRHVNYSTKFGFDIYNISSGGSTLVSNTVVVQDKWQHLAVVRSGTNIALYINGVLDNSITTSVNVDGGGSTFWCAGSENGNPNTVINGYIDDLRITKGYARYTQNFTPPSQSFATQYISTGYDANYADVSLLLNGSGTNGSTTFTDLSSSPKTITSTVTSISTAVKKYGTGSLYFGGTNAGLKATYGPQTITGDFTFECWVYPTAKPELYPSVFGTGDNWVDNGCIVLFAGHNYWGSTKYQFCWYGMDSGGNPFIQSSSTIVYNAWTHIALVRKGTTYTLYLNGVADGSCTNSRTVNIETVISAGGGFNGYMDDFRFSRIARYTTNFTPPTYQLPTDTTGTVIDPLRISTSLLLRGNGTNGSTSFTDESPNGLTVTNNGSVTVNTTTKKYGTGSMAFSGSNYLGVSSNALFNFGTIDFTMEGWFYKTVNGNVPSIVGNNKAWEANSWAVCASHYTWPNTIGLYVYNMNNTAPIVKSTSTLSLNTWYHFAVTRSGSTIRLFLNGALEATGTSSASLNVADDIIAIGNNYGDYLNGYIDDLRITKGFARYTANFTPPTYEDPIITGTVYDYNYPQISLLLNGDGTNGSTVFKDLSGTPKTVTAYGNVQISTAQKKFGTGSMYFDGSGDYLSMPSVGNVGTSDLTVDAWVNLGTSPGGWGHPLIDTRASNGASTGFAVQIESNGSFGIYTGGGYAGSTATGIFTFNTWHHIAVVRNNSTWKCFIDGVQILTFTNSNNFTDTTCLIGTNIPQNGALQGYIDDLRITKGLARYTQNFTPPTAPLPVSGGY